MRNDRKASSKLNTLSCSRRWPRCILEVTSERIISGLLLAFVSWLRHPLSHRILRGRVGVKFATKVTCCTHIGPSFIGVGSDRAGSGPTTTQGCDPFFARGTSPDGLLCHDAQIRFSPRRVSSSFLSNSAVTLDFLTTQLNNYDVIVWRTNTYSFAHTTYWYVGQTVNLAAERKYAG